MNSTENPKSLEESLKILDEYKKNISKNNYDLIYSNIHNFAIENIFLDRNNILSNIKILNKESNVDLIIKEMISNFKEEEL